MAVGCVHGRAMPLCGVGATGRVHAMNFGTWMVMNDTADASTHLAMKRRHGDRRRLLARDSNHGQGQRPGSSPAGCDASRVNRREPPVVRGKTNDNPPGRQIVPYHRALAPPRNTTAQHAITPSGREKHNHHPRQQQPATATTTHIIHLTGTATPPTSTQTTRANSNHHPQADYLSQET